MQISRAEVQHIARLARLHLGEAEEEAFTRQLNQVLEHVAKLNELDTTGVEPTYHVLATLRNVWRPDEVRPGLSQQDALRNAPDPAAGGFRVPKIVEG